MKLRLLPLEHRRQISDLLLFYKSRNGLVSLDLNDYLHTFVSRYQTRNFGINNYNLLIRHKQDYFRKSFLLELRNSGIPYPLTLTVVCIVLMYRGWMAIGI